MTLYFKRKILRNQFLIPGLLWTAIGSIQFISSFFEEQIKWFEIIFLILGITYLGTFFWNKKRGLITIGDNFLSKNDLISKELYVKDIESYRIFTSEYKFKTNKKDFVIDTQLIDDKSKELLLAFIEKHQITKV